MGNCGSGKTSFFNNICNTNYDNNLTRDIAFEDVCFVPTKTFRIYDTPGLNSPHNSYESALILRACLTTLPLNMIIIH